MTTQFRISGKQHAQLKQHLLPEDGKEAVAIVLCGSRRNEDTNILLARKLVLVPHEECSVREWDCITWPTAQLNQALHEAMQKNWSIVKIHSHPNGFPQFSKTDDASDRELFPSIHGWLPEAVRECDYAA